jgi:transcription elongation factor GreA
VEKNPLDEEASDSLERTVLHWRGSERRLQPVLEFLRGSGHGEVADLHEKRRSATAHTLLEGKSTEDIETRHTIMSRPTWERLEAEFKKLKLDLKTVIPAAIEKARQLGDLRENAEYDAAKQRQANAAARAQELMNLLDRTRLLETIEVDPSRVGVGTEVSLSPVDPSAAPTLQWWILGEGDHDLGPGILSYRAPILRPLLGKSEGAEVALEMPEGERRYRIASIRKRLPES